MTERVWLDREDIEALRELESRPAFAAIPTPVSGLIRQYVRAYERQGRWGGGEDILTAVQEARAGRSRRRAVWATGSPVVEISAEASDLLEEVRALLVRPRPTGSPEAEASAGPVEPTPEATPDNVVAERQRRIDAGERYGIDALADHFVVGPTTIRRRLGRLK